MARNGNGHPAAPAFVRFTCDLSREDHAKFKSKCALCGSTMSAEVGALIARELSDPDRMLSEALHIYVSADLKREFEEYASKRRVSLGVVLMEAVAALERRSEGPQTQAGFASPPIGNGHRKRGRPLKPEPEFPRGISKDAPRL
jgi:hypothetical protein